MAKSWPSNYKIAIMQKSLTIIGAGAWGSALAIILSDKFDEIFLIDRDKENIKKLGRQHPALSRPFTNAITLSHDISSVAKSEGVLIAAPSYAFSDILEKIKPHLNEHQYISWATKGFDSYNECFLHETFNKILPAYKACIISGPTFATEIVEKKPAAIVVASKDKKIRDYWARTIQTNALRAYTNTDIIGVQVGGCVKNILAIAAGIANGLSFGANTQAALITRGLAEMTRLGVALGAEKLTFQGLSGMGDLILTCSDDLSRNRRFGKELANNNSIDKALSNIGATVEGFNALRLVLGIAKKHQIEMPICEQVLAVVEGRKTPTDAVTDLLLRKSNPEY